VGNVPYSRDGGTYADCATRCINVNCKTFTFYNPTTGTGICYVWPDSMAGNDYYVYQNYPNWVAAVEDATCV
tara:strand:- start:4844 stop:5059 length:216 start_codon:yes stop_codon:yes gene_type:complete